ncbi:hypothetical protein [Massilia sp. ST3]|uniref:hypothetical protein n=1 Tax=Massilia sp. ST3 TaxID=2824903 RepID=UPI001B821208|nr:hypothetical protein [Massilia sp. ST3]MBQ5948435.1 hypothetical protein [Massilia sp. ST3]
MSELHRITDANLISARCYGIELDVEGTCETLASRLGREKRPLLAELADLLRHEKMFRAIVLHAWPDPRDPAVVELQAQARRGLAQVDTLTGRRRR